MLIAFFCSGVKAPPPGAGAAVGAGTGASTGAGGCHQYLSDLESSPTRPTMPLRSSAMAALFLFLLDIDNWADMLTEDSLHLKVGEEHKDMPSRAEEVDEMSNRVEDDNGTLNGVDDNNGMLNGVDDNNNGTLN